MYDYNVINGSLLKREVSVERFEQYCKVNRCDFLSSDRLRLDLEHAELFEKVLELFIVSSLGAGGGGRRSRSAVVAKIRTNINSLLLRCILLSRLSTLESKHTTHKMPAMWP